MIPTNLSTEGCSFLATIDMRVVQTGMAKCKVAPFVGDDKRRPYKYAVCEIVLFTIPITTPSRRIERFNSTGSSIKLLCRVKRKISCFYLQESCSAIALANSMNGMLPHIRKHIKGIGPKYFMATLPNTLTVLNDVCAQNSARCTLRRLTSDIVLRGIQRTSIERNCTMSFYYHKERVQFQLRFFHREQRK